MEELTDIVALPPLGPLGSVKSRLRFWDDIGPKPSEILVDHRAFLCFFSFMTQAHCSSFPGVIP